MSDNVRVGKNLSVKKSENPFQGCFGYQGKWEDTKEVTVVKLKKENCRYDWESIVGEDHQSKLKALHVLKIVGYKEDSDWRYFAFEPYESTLYEYVNSPEKYKGLPLPSESIVLYQIVRAVKYLHKKMIVHGDLNPLTICIESRNVIDINARIKVRESLNENNEKIFEFEEHAVDEKQLKTLVICQRKYWRRAKRIDCQPDFYDDLFAVGCLMYYFLVRHHPFAPYGSSSNGDKILENIGNKTPTHFLNAGEMTKEHFAYKYIERLILPENDTYCYMRDFNQTKEQLKDALPLKIDFNKPLGKSGYF